MNIHEDHTADKDHADLPANEVLEHGDMVDQIKGLAIIQKASIDSRSLVDKEIDHFYGCPGTHTGRAALLESKLVWVSLQFLVKDDENYPIKDFQDDGAQCNSSIIATIICRSSLVLN